MTILIGDLNKHVGNDEKGVEGNLEKISFGGQFIRDLVDSGDYLIMNNSDKCVGGPWTWRDPANPNNRSCLDLVIVSSQLSPFVEEILVDSDRKYGMSRVIREKGRLVQRFSDHFTICVTLGKLSVGNNTVTKVSDWNLRKEGGWEKYCELTNGNFGKLHELVNQSDVPIDVVVNKVEQEHTKIKFKAFGKETRKYGGPINPSKPGVNGYSDEDEPQDVPGELLTIQSQRIEKELQAIRNLPKGRNTRVFKTLERIRGPKKPPPRGFCYY